MYVYIYTQLYTHICFFMYIRNLHIYIHTHRYTYSNIADSTDSCRVFSETNSEVNDKEVLRHAASVRCSSEG